jgi:hypothetical protein
VTKKPPQATAVPQPASGMEPANSWLLLINFSFCPVTFGPSAGTPPRKRPKVPVERADYKNISGLKLPFQLTKAGFEK